MNQEALTPARMLEGMTLESGWEVGAIFERASTDSGGNFSVGYLVENEEGKRGFLKALDFYKALSGTHGDPALVLEHMTKAFNYEREVCERCVVRGMDRVIHALDHGSVTVPAGGLNGVVQYIIFELADTDVRKVMNRLDKVDVAWALRTLHHAATGLQQLHSEQIAHRDLKPSNVVQFEDARISKLSDLGSASRRGAHSVRDDVDIAGDRGYAPPELLYGHFDPDWSCRQLGCDIYQLGSLATFLLCGATMPSLLLANLSPDHHYDSWGESYEDVLPYLQQAFAKCLDQVRGHLPHSIQEDLISIISQLCDPDLRQRGDPVNRSQAQNPFSLQRYVSKFDRLATKVEAETWKAE